MNFIIEHEGTNSMKISRVEAIVVAVTLLAGSAVALAQADETPRSGEAAVVVDAKGNLRVPENYQTRYQALGAWAIAKDEGAGSKEIHQVYASPGAIDAYRKTGHFPDGTVLVKEVFDTSTNSMTTGTVSHSDQLKGWFVMVRDSENTHPGNPLWGNGWGWSWFDADEPLKTTSTNYKAECLACHIPAQADDWLYVNGYPVLRH
jgi:hypothetical protein